MHSNKALTSMLFQCVKMTKSIIHAIYSNPDDQAVWCNVLQLMYHLRQALACSMCGKLVSDPYTPIQDPCHCVCANCRNGNTQMHYNCATCRMALQSNGEGFEMNSDLKFSAVSFEKLCKLLSDKKMEYKWSNLQVSTQNGPITFGQLIKEGYCSSGVASVEDDTQNLGDKFRKPRAKEMEHHCRCGSGAKGKALGNLTCLGQRCLCYRKGKGCINCKCVGCKNPNGVPFLQEDTKRNTRKDPSEIHNSSGILPHHPEDPSPLCGYSNHENTS